MRAIPKRRRNPLLRALLPTTLVLAACTGPRSGAHEAEGRPAPAGRVTFASLLAEMVDRTVVARLAAAEFRTRMASSRNRASRQRGEPSWFADDDGTGFERTEQRDGRTEWVLFDQRGPGCLTRLWTPDFHAGNLQDHVGPNVRVYLDDDEVPVFDEPWIPLLLGKGSIPRPFASATARAGLCYLPIPFARACKVTTTARPFYHTIEARAYAPDVVVETFRKSDLVRHAAALAATAARLAAPDDEARNPPGEVPIALPAGGVVELPLPAGAHVVRRLQLALRPHEPGTAWLRSTVLELECDRARTVWCPLGDFFASPDDLHPHETWERTVRADGTLISRWPMPYERHAVLRLHNLGEHALVGQVALATEPWAWDRRSLHFHAQWRPDEILPGTPIVDLTLADLVGEGHLAGDVLCVLNPTQGWWGEGDEKIYVDSDWALGFPTCFGTGTEDYYGWAGGVVPTRADEFARFFVANVRVGGQDGNATRGFNVCTRSRVLDRVPFRERLRFDLEASAGTDQRAPTDMLGYGAVVFWYARPGSRGERVPAPERAARPLHGLADLEAAARRAAEGVRRR